MRSVLLGFIGCCLPAFEAPFASPPPPHRPLTYLYVATLSSVVRRAPDLGSTTVDSALKNGGIDCRLVRYSPATKVHDWISSR